MKPPSENSLRINKGIKSRRILQAAYNFRKNKKRRETERRAAAEKGRKVRRTTRAGKGSFVEKKASPVCFERGPMAASAKSLAAGVSVKALPNAVPRNALFNKSPPGRRTQQHTIDVGDVAGHQVRVFEIKRVYPTNAPLIGGMKIVESWTR